MELFLYILVALLALLLVLCLLWLVAIKPARPRAALSPLFAWDYAHRGFHDEKIPENSLGAFRAAVEHGYGMELDVQLSRDRKLVVFHDRSIQRLCGAPRNIDETDYGELQTYPLLQSDERIPLFTDVLKLVDGRTPMIIEIKTHNLKDLEACRVLVEELRGYEGLYCIESFNPFVVEWFKKNAPQIVRGQLSARQRIGTLIQRVEMFILGNLLLNFKSKPDFIAYNFPQRNTLSYRVCARLYKPGRVAWTIRTREDYKTAMRAFDAVIFENFPADQKLHRL